MFCQLYLSLKDLKLDKYSINVDIYLTKARQGRYYESVETGRRPAGKENKMKQINLLTLILIVVGGLNWGLVGSMNFDLVATIFGDGSVLARIVYVLVGISAIYQITTLFSGEKSSSMKSAQSA